MFSDFIDDFSGLLFALFVIALLGGVVWLAVWSGNTEEKQKAAACAHALDVARTSGDSVAVVLKCEMPSSEKTNTVVIPMYVPR